MGCDKLGDADLIGFGRGGAEGECDIAESQLEQPAALDQLLALARSSSFRSAGAYPTRDELHERH